MNTGKAELTSIIDVPASRVYSILADYRQGHPAILPRKYFRKADVEAGGTGAGTRLNIEMKVLGTVKSFRHVVSEPQPGRVLVESDVEGTTVTTFTVDPVGDGSACSLKIETQFPVRPGIAGTIERSITSTMLRRIYAEEIAMLREYARK